MSKIVVEMADADKITVLQTAHEMGSTVSALVRGLLHMVASGVLPQAQVSEYLDAPKQGRPHKGTARTLPREPPKPAPVKPAKPKTKRELAREAKKRAEDEKNRKLFQEARDNLTEFMRD